MLFKRMCISAATKANSRYLGVCISLFSLELFLISFLLISPPASAQNVIRDNPPGVAWRVIGGWRIAGHSTLVAAGDAVRPGSLLEAVQGGHEHSITLLLPDGQRIFYECFASRDCERGFRVPSLYKKPAPMAVDLLSRVNAVSRHLDDPHTPRKQEDSGPSRDEAVALIGSDNKVEVAGLAGGLSDGNYTYKIEPFDHSNKAQTSGHVEKHGKVIDLQVPAEGLFTVLIYDRLNTPRVELLLAALHQPRSSAVSKGFQDVAALLKDWNENYQGWPAHEFRRYYLMSVMLGVEPSKAISAPLPAVDKASQANVTCEPLFSPTPGVFKTDTEVTLHCRTEGATVHYTVDGSQPLDGAPVYRTPIIVKGTALTIKAFATSEGKKASPVVTGIFRIGD